ncbi:MAG: efflux RND transporter periplasmic adaptor subunit [Burkholderiales bacterium]|nr:MAG: efflux RND transporter periplasmic adaptor subunit [Burkholderiales bacterium]
MGLMTRKSWLPIAALVVLSAVAGWWWTRQDAGPAQQYRTALIERGSLQASVSASGTVNPVTQVSVGTQVSGQIREIHADFNDEVRAGQLIAEIDPESFEYRVRSAQADLDAARASVLTAQANAAATRANVSRARTELVEARRVHERNLQLVVQGFISQSEADRTQAAFTAAQESLKSAEALAAVSEAQIRSAQATVAQRESSLAQARVDLGRTRITSPVDGIVIKRAVERGQTVAASLQAPELFVIAQNLADMQVDASIDEADVGRIRSGQQVNFTVDAFPGQTFEGVVRQVRKAAQNVSNVVTYTAVIGFANTGGRLLPGMTANVRVVTDAREGVLKVPNAALRVRIAGVEPTAVAAGGGAPAPASAPASNGPAAPAAAGARGPMSEFRNRVVDELALRPEQVDKLDGLIAAAGPRFMALRDLDEAGRTRARERILADLRAGIGEMLDEGQRPRFAAIVAEAAGRQTSRGRIFLLGSDGRPVALDVRLGISDGTATELVVPPGSPGAGVLVEGASVITAVTGGLPASAPRAATTGPRLPF